jgi:hypothetical protein
MPRTAARWRGQRVGLAHAGWRRSAGRRVRPGREVEPDAGGVAALPGRDAAGRRRRSAARRSDGSGRRIAARNRAMSPTVSCVSAARRGRLRAAAHSSAITVAARGMSHHSNADMGLLPRRGGPRGTRLASRKGTPSPRGVLSERARPPERRTVEG